MQLKQEQGVLRVHGRNEAQTTGEGGYPGSAAESIASDEAAKKPSIPSGSEDLWGFGSENAQSKNDADVLNKWLHLNPGILRHLLNSYLENIHVFHFFINKHRIIKLFRRFSLRYNRSDQHRKWIEELFERLSGTKNLDDSRELVSNLPESAKRNHSIGQFQNLGFEVNYLANQSSHQLQFERSPETAMILPMMTLKKICDCKKPLLGPASFENKEICDLRSHFSSPSLMTNSPSSLSVRQSSASSVQSTAVTKTTFSTTSGSIGFLFMKSVGESSPTAPKNADVISELEYYAFATDILRNCHNDHKLIHTQMFLLADLYVDQLVRGFESFDWIHFISKMCIYFVRK